MRIEARRDETAARAVRRALARELVVSACKLTRITLTGKMREALGTISFLNTKIGSTDIELGVERSTGRADSGDVAVDLLELVEDVTTALSVQRHAARSTQHAANQRDWPFYVIEAGLPSLPRVLSETRSYAERLFNYRAIGKLDRDDAAYALREPAERLGAEHDGRARRTPRCHGRLSLVLGYGQAAWTLASDRLMTTGDARAAVLFGTEQLDAGFFRSRWERATPSEPRTLYTMAGDGEGTSPTAAVAQRMGLQTSKLGPYRAALISKGVVYARSMDKLYTPSLAWRDSSPATTTSPTPPRSARRQFQLREQISE